MKLLLKLAMLLSFALPAFADVFEHPLNDSALLSKAVYSPAALSGKFTQTRQITSMNVTLNSKGEFALDKKKGILWRTSSPIENELIIKGERICTAGTSGAKSIDLSENKNAAEMLRVINSIFTQEYEKAAAWFDFYFELEDSVYTLGLVAKDKTMAQVIERMTVQGAKYVETIILRSQNGDITTIVFSDIEEKTSMITCP